MSGLNILYIVLLLFGLTGLILGGILIKDRLKEGTKADDFDVLVSGLVFAGGLITAALAVWLQIRY